MTLTIATTADGDTAILRCDGRIVLGTGDVLETTVRTAWVGGAKRIVLDLSGVNYMDSSGIGQLVSAYTTTRNAGGELVLAGVTNRVRDLLQITKLYTVFQVFDTADAALESFGRAAPSQVGDEPKT